MKRMHIHIAVNDLSENVSFYSILFDTLPTVQHQDYAKWQLDNPAVNFAISTQGHSNGINHLGIQVDSAEELQELTQRFENAEITYTSQEEITCCYANSNKHWLFDPQGNAWESFHTLSDAPVIGGEANIDIKNELSGCCIPLNPNHIQNENSACCIPRDDSTCCA